MSVEWVFIIIFQSSLSMYHNRSPIFQLLFTVIANLLIIFNAGVNPIMYATTVPEFKETIEKLFMKRSEVDEVTKLQTN